MGIQSAKIVPIYSGKSKTQCTLALPTQFHWEKPFSTVIQFKEKLTAFHDFLHNDVNKACEYWKEILAEEFEVILSVVFRESERVLG